MHPANQSAKHPPNQTLTHVFIPPSTRPTNLVPNQPTKHPPIHPTSNSTNYPTFHITNQTCTQPTNQLKGSPKDLLTKWDILRWYIRPVMNCTGRVLNGYAFDLGWGSILWLFMTSFLLKSNQIFILLSINLHFVIIFVYYFFRVCRAKYFFFFSVPPRFQPSTDAFLIFHFSVDILLFDRTLSQVPMCV